MESLMMTKIYHSKEYLIEQLKTKDYLQIAEENKVDSSTIQRWLRKHKLTSDYDYWSSEEIKLLKENYENNLEVHKLFPNRTESSVHHKANRLKLKKEVFRKEYSVNEDFFKKWTPEMAYVFGFICSDGCVHSNRNCCSLHLHKKDLHIVEHIRSVMESNNPIHVYRDSCYLRINSKTLCDDLKSLGCKPRKSIVLQFPNVPEEHLSHFIRGFFDGDGSIHFNKPNTIKIAFIAGKQFLEVMQKRLNETLGLRIGPLQQHFKVYIALYYGDDARKFCNWIYENSKGLHLNRKKERFDNHIIKGGKWLTNKRY